MFCCPCVCQNIVIRKRFNETLITSLILDSQISLKGLKVSKIQKKVIRKKNLQNTTNPPLIVFDFASLNLKIDMEHMQDQNCAQEFQEIYNDNRSTDDMLFDRIISEIQETVIDPQFQKSLAGFMKNHWNIFDQGCPIGTIQQVFAQYKSEMCEYLHNKIVKTIPEFQWKRFGQLLQSRNKMVDEQILDTLHSLEDIESFKSFVKDYRNSYEEVEQFRVLTIKSNKISENKTVKGKDNIFNQVGGMEKEFKPLPKKKEVKDKSEGELMVPEMILTVKGMRKG